MRRVPAVRQHDASDCGAACLASIAGANGRRVSIALLRQLSFSDRTGTSILGLIRAAEQTGFSARGVRAADSALPHAPVPAIAHMRLEGGGHHFVVLERVSRDDVWLMDPATGEHRRERRSTFAASWTGALILLTPAAARRELAPHESMTQRVRRLVAPHGAALMQALFGTLLYTVLGLSISIFVQQIVDGVLADGRTGALHVMGIAMVAIAVAQTVLGAARSRLMLNVAQHIDAALILGYYSHLIRLPQAFFDRMRVGELTSRVTDAVKIRAFVGEVAVEGAASLLLVVAAMAMMLAYDWRLALWTAAAMPVYGALYAVGARMNRRQQGALMRRGAALEAQLVESLSAIGTVKRFGLEPLAAAQTERRFVRLFRTVGDSASTAIWLGGASQLTSRLCAIGLLWLGAALALEQRLSAGELMSCYALLSFLTGPILSLVGFSRAAEEARVASERLFELMELEPERTAGIAPPAGPGSNDVVLEGVTFRYAGRTAALADVSFRCASGEITAIVGESGSRKSTVAALVQRLYAPDSGRILLGRHDVAHLGLESLRRRVGLVPQSPDLFAGTVLENLAIGDPAPDVDRLALACEQVGLLEAIERMPSGWLTPVGERGMALSGGERQRLAIVRALYRQPDVLLLDEATSALDALHERLVLDTIRDAARRGTTVILVAHRRSAVEISDHVVLLRRGRVVQTGRHGELARGSGPYAMLWTGERSLPEEETLALG